MRTKLLKNLPPNLQEARAVSGGELFTNRLESSRKNSSRINQNGDLAVKETLNGIEPDDPKMSIDILKNKNSFLSRDLYSSDSLTKEQDPLENTLSIAELKKFSIVVEGRSGKTSVAEICRREKISQDTFLEWTSDYLKRNRFNVATGLSDRERAGFKKNRNLVLSVAGSKVFQYLENYVDFSNMDTLVLPNLNGSELSAESDYGTILCFEKVNDIRYINKFFERVNRALSEDALFVGALETFVARKERKAINSIPVLRDFYFAIEFVLKRIFPKVSFTKRLYFDITKGNDRLMSKAEGLGRLVSCGFKIMDYKTIDGILYFVVKKKGEPAYNMSPSYGPVYKMPRIGKNGKVFGVYKLRTMHPFSEYLQDYIVNAHGYAESGKPADDFRVPKWGKIVRKFWLDELPQLFNVLKGEMKLVGVRPVSRRYFEDIPREMQKLRLTQKPGCIPPYVSLNRSGSVMSVLQAEKQYLEEKIAHPYFTDLKYFFLAIFNIIFRNKRSA
jgi:lipopolysaccharide/colanic/teichoic acid biosynthesis glycosyltransferase